MRVILPSKGFFGTKSLRLRNLTIDDLRKIDEFNNDDFIKKFSLVKLLTDVDFNKISYNDLEYLYQLALYGCTHHTAIFRLKCPECGKEFNSDFYLSSAEVKTLDKKNAQFNKYVNGVKFNFRILSAQDVLDCYDYSLFSEHHLTFEQCLTLQTACGSLEGPYPPYFYESLVNTFNRLNFHGLDLRTPSVCTHCKHKFHYDASLSMDIFKGALEKIMGSFANVCDFISFEDLLKFTVYDYSTFITNLNKRLNG